MYVKRKKEKLKEGWKADKKRKVMESLQGERSKEFVWENNETAKTREEER